MFFFKRCTFFYNGLTSHFKIDWKVNSMAYCLLYKLVLRVNFILGNNFFFALNSKEAVNFFSIKKILDARTLQSFRVLKIYGLGFKVSLAEEMIKLDLG